MSTPTFLAPSVPELTDEQIRMQAVLAAAENETTPASRVLIETPFAAGSTTGATLNQLYGRAALRDSLMRGEAPMVPHLLYQQTYVLDEGDPDERQIAEAAGRSWLPFVDRVAVYVDREITPAMRAGIERARSLGIEVEERSVPDWKRG